MSISSLLYIYCTFTVIHTHAIDPLPKPENVTIVSNNFRHVLQWNPGKETPPGTIYCVSIHESSSKQKRKVFNTTRTVINVSKYMKNILVEYTLQLWAELGNRSSPQNEILFVPIRNSIIGPPSVSLQGYENCLNISVSLPKRPVSKESEIFFRAAIFNIDWKKARDEKVYTIRFTDAGLTSQQNETSCMYTFSLRDLQPGEEYCVRVHPQFNSNHKTRSSKWFCAFTRKEEPRGVAFIGGWTIIIVLVVLGLLMVGASLVYTRRKTSLPKTLTGFVPSSFLFPEETDLSVAEILSIGKSSKPERQEEDRENVRNLNDDHDDDDDDNDHGRQHAYMERAANHSYSRASSSGRSSAGTSAALSELAETPEEGAETPEEGAEFAPVKAGFGSSSLLQIQQKLSKPAVLAGLRTETPNPPTLDKAQTEGLINKPEKSVSENINLLSVTLRSLEPGENPVDEEENKPLLKLLLTQVEEDVQKGEHTHIELQTHTPLTQEHQPVSPDRTRGGYMATHKGRIDTESDCLLEEEEEEEEEESCSAYMGR